MGKNIPILMYHGVVDEKTKIPPEREEGAGLYDVKIENFIEQIDWLSSNGFTTTFDCDVTEEKKVVLTFDDGEMNNFTNAFPVLCRKGFKAYFFVIGNRIGKDGYMGWDELRQMHEAGMVIGSHGLSHEILTNLKPTQIEQELLAPKKYIGRNLGIEVTTMSIPRGFCDNDVVSQAHALGYMKVFISDRPRNLTESCYERIAVRENWTVDRFILAIKGVMPLHEKFLKGLKAILKKTLREPGYNFIRKCILFFGK